MGMGMRKLGGAHHIGMGIDPEDAQLGIFAVQISNGRKVDQTISAKCHDPVRVMPLDGRSRCLCL